VFSLKYPWKLLEKPIFQFKHITQHPRVYFEMPEITYKTDLDNVDWAEMKTTLRQDAFDNGRSPEQLKISFENSYAACVAYANNRIVGTARVLSDGICNAYLVDVWTLSAYRRQGVATTMIQKLLSRLKGQHVYLFTDDVPGFYAKLGFVEQPIGMGQVIETWLINES
jgi:predicted GNAT family acetyltransferase